MAICRTVIDIDDESTVVIEEAPLDTVTLESMSIRVHRNDMRED